MNEYLKRIKEETLNILSECPTFENKIYLLEDYSFDKKNVLVMYDTFYHERKSLKIDKDGVYFNGRKNNDDPSKIYLADFKEFEFSEEDAEKIKKVINEKLKKLDTRIPSRDIKPGYICREFRKNDKRPSYYIYLGKVSAKPTFRYNYAKAINKENVYIWLGVGEEKPKEFKVDKYYSRYDIPTKKSKIRFDKIARKLTEREINALKKEIEDTEKYEDIVWFSK